MKDQLENLEEEIIEAEESLTQLGPGETFDGTIDGLHVVMNYNAEQKLFTGTLKNTTEDTLVGIEVEILLSNGTELGPEKFAEMTPEMDFVVDFAAGEEEFDTWTVEVEVGGDDEGEAEQGDDNGDDGDDDEDDD